MKQIALLTLFFFGVGLLGSSAVYADVGLASTIDEHGQMDSGNMNPDALMQSTGDWEFETVDVSGEATDLTLIYATFSDVMLNIFGEALLYLLKAMFSFGSLPETKTDKSPDGSKTKTTFFENSERIKRQEFYDASGKLVSGWEIYESGVYRWRKAPSTGILKDNGFESYYDDISSGVMEGDYYLGRVAEVVYSDNTGHVNEYVSGSSFQISQSREFKTDPGDSMKRELRSYTNYEYFGDSTRIKSEMKYDASGRLISGYERYESGNLKLKVDHLNGNNLLYFADAVDVDETGFTLPRILSETTETGVLISEYFYDPATGLLKEHRSYDAATGKNTGYTLYTYWNNGSAKTRERFDADGLLTHRDTRYRNGRIQSEYRQATNQTAYFSNEEVSVNNGKIYGHLLRVVYADGEDYFVYDERDRVSQRWVYQRGILVETETSEYADNVAWWEVQARTVRSFDRNGKVTKITRYDKNGAVVSTVYPEDGDRGTSDVVEDYDITYAHSILSDATGDGIVDGADYTVWADQYLNRSTGGKSEGDFNSDGLVDNRDLEQWSRAVSATPISYRYVVQYHPGTDKLKKIERYEDGILISVSEHSLEGAIQKLDVVSQRTTYQFASVDADPAAVQLKKITFSNNGNTIDIAKAQTNDGTRLIVYDRWMRSIKSVYDTGSWIKTEYRYDEFVSEAERVSKLKESLFDENGLLVRGLEYDDNEHNTVRTMIDRNGNVLDCGGDDCLQYDAGLRDVEALSRVDGASVAVIEAADSLTKHGAAVSDVISTLTGAGTRVQIFNPGQKLSQITAAIRSAADMGFKVINLSLEFSVSSISSLAAEVGVSAADALLQVRSALENAVDYARSKNAIVVAAAGNDDPELSVLADLEGVVSVGASDILGRHRPTSNTGDALDITANGYQVYSNVVSDDGKPWSGTSFATPIVSAIISKLTGYLFSLLGSDADTDLVIDAINASADDLGLEGHDSVFGWGKIDVAGALATLFQFAQ